MASKTSLKKRIGAVSNFIALVLCRLIRQMLADFLKLNSRGLYQSSGKEKKVSALYSPPRQNVELGSFTS